MNDRVEPFQDRGGVTIAEVVQYLLAIARAAECKDVADACPMGALRYVDESEVDRDRAEVLDATAAFGPKVFYYNLPKRFVAATVFNSILDEVVRTLHTDEFGDFKFDQVAPAKYTVRIARGQSDSLVLTADALEGDIVFDDIDIA